MHFFLSPATNKSQRCRAHLHRGSFESHTHTATPGPPCGRRDCCDAAIQWAPASSGRSAASLSLSTALLRQTSRDGLSFSTREQEAGLRELPRCIWRGKLISALLFYSRPRFCEDERWLHRPGVHLTRGRLRGKMS